MRTCPYCRQEALGVLRKSVLGPIRSTRCKSCGKRISVHPRSLWAVMPFLAGIALAIYLEWSPLGIAALVVGAIAMFLVHEHAVPLVGREAEGSDPA